MISVCTYVKTAHYHINNFIRHYASIGFDKVYILDDVSINRVSDLLNTTSDIEVEVIRANSVMNNPCNFCQTSMGISFNYFNLYKAKESEWVMIVMEDEYLNLPDPKTIKEFIKDIDSVGSISFNMTGDNFILPSIRSITKTKALVGFGDISFPILKHGFKQIDSYGYEVQVPLLGRKIPSKIYDGNIGNGFVLKKEIKESISPKQKIDLDVVIYVQVYYADVWKKIEFFLNEMNFKFDLVVGIQQTEEHRNLAINIQAIFPFAKIVEVDNIGLDIGSFLQCFMKHDEMFSHRHKYLLKVHTKKSPYSGYGALWMHKLLNQLMNSERLIDTIAKMDDDCTIGMAGQAEWLLNTNTHPEPCYGCNTPYLQQLFNMFGIEKKEFSFVGGTMFLVRLSVLDKFLTKEKCEQLLQRFPSGYFNEPSLVHAFERMFGVLVANTESNKIVAV